MVGGEATSAVEKLVSGVRQAADFAEQFRSYSESEKQWKARMEFILRHLPDYRDPPDGGGRLDQLLSLSMVWANHLFLGCSYNRDLLDKVMEMADGIEVEDLPQFTSRSELMRKPLNVKQPEFIMKLSTPSEVRDELKIVIKAKADLHISTLGTDLERSPGEGD